MLFGTPLFLFAFLPVALLGTWLLARGWGGRAACAGLLAASVVFLGYAGVRDVAVFAASIAFNIAAARWIAGAPAGPRRQRAVVAAVAANLLILAVFKASSGLGPLAGALGSAVSLSALALPLGLSFYSFQQIAYLVALGRGAARVPALEHATFVAFFPHLVAGPILRHDELVPQLTRETFRPRVDDLATGAAILCGGLFMKLCLADAIAPTVDATHALAARGIVPNAVEAWTATLGFAAQIFLDFAGYSEMATGLARMFGIHFPVNFDRPFAAPTPAAFWRRWHVTLSRFLREHLYDPLRRGRPAASRLGAGALLATFVLSGLWHGVASTFLVWGTVSGLVVAVELVVVRPWFIRQAWHRSIVRGLIPLGAALTTLQFALLMIVFRAPSLDAAAVIGRGLLGEGGGGLPAMFEALGIAAGLPDAWFGPGRADPEYDLGGGYKMIANTLLVLIGLGWGAEVPALSTLSRRGLAVVVVIGFAFVVQVLLVGAPSRAFVYFQF